MGAAVTRQEWYQLRVQNLKDKISMEDLLSYCGVDIPIPGRSAQVSCPMKFNHAHDDVKKSARYYPESNTFKCYVCTSKAVDIIGFVECYERCKFASAISWLEKNFNIAVPKAELLKEIHEVMDEILDAEDDTLRPKLEGKRQHGLNTLQMNRDLFTMEQFVGLHAVLDEVWFDLTQGKTTGQKALVIVDRWLDKIRDIIKTQEPSFDA